MGTHGWAGERATITVRAPAGAAAMAVPETKAPTASNHDTAPRLTTVWRAVQLTILTFTAGD